MSGREASVRGRLAKTEWLAAVDVDAGDRNGAIYLAAPISKETALSILSPHFEREVSVVWKGLIPKARVSTRAGRLLIQEELRPCTKNEASEALKNLLMTQGLEILPWDENAEAYPGSFRIREQDTPRKLLDRIRYYTKQVYQGAEEQMYSQWTNETLIAEVESWLIPFIWNGEAASDGPVLTAVDLYLALKERLGWATMQVMNREVPPLFISPAGTVHPIDYHSGDPLVSLKIQEVYGMAETPLIMGQPLTFELLSPAGRPIQVTKDLGRFWKGSYAEVRKEMRGRYPKHDWPEDPSHAQPHTRVFKS
jgi:ATP-dependent helicase HrpB